MTRAREKHESAAVRRTRLGFPHWSAAALQRVGVNLLLHAETGWADLGLTGDECAMLAEETMRETARRLTARLFQHGPTT